MPPAQLLTRMAERFQILSSTGGRLDRQARLRTTFDWSWDLLTSAEKAALAQLSVFEGGFTLEAVEAVVDLAPCDEEPLAMDALQSLVQKSFVRRVSDTRFDLLISVKEYAAEHLASEGRFPGSGRECLRAAEARHGRYFAGLSEEAVTRARHAEIDNLVVACRRAVFRGEGHVAARTLEHAWTCLRFRGPFAAGIELAALVGTMGAMSSNDAARVEWVHGRALAISGKDAAALEHLEGGLVRAREAVDAKWEARLLIALGAASLDSGHVEDARERYREALAVARKRGYRDSECAALNGEGNDLVAVGRIEEARARYEEALALVRTTGHRDVEGSILGNLASVCGVSLGLNDISRAYHEAAVELARAIGDSPSRGEQPLQPRCPEPPGTQVRRGDDAIEARVGHRARAGVSGARERRALQSRPRADGCRTLPRGRAQVR